MGRIDVRVIEKGKRNLPEIYGSASGDAFPLARIRVPFELDRIGTAARGACCLAGFLRAELVIVPSSHRLN